MAAVGADVGSHVLDQAEDGHAHLLEHLHALLGVDQGDVLGRGDDHGARHGHALGQRQLDVAGAGRHVHQQVVQILPVGLAQHLLQRLRGHGAAPDHGLVVVDQETDGHDLHAMAFHGLHGLAVGAFGAAGNAHHHGLAGAVDVGVQNAHARALGGQRQRQVGRGRALAHAALAGRDGDDVLDARQQLHAALHRMRCDLGRDVDRDIAHALDGLGRRDELAAQRRHQALRRVAHLHVEGHVGPRDLQVAQGAGAHIVLAGVGVEHAGERGQERLFCDCHCFDYS